VQLPCLPENDIYLNPCTSRCEIQGAGNRFSVERRSRGWIGIFGGGFELFGYGCGGTGRTRGGANGVSRGWERGRRYYRLSEKTGDPPAPCSLLNDVITTEVNNEDIK
jgi:hypothetical protein